MNCKNFCKNFAFAIITLIFSGIAIALLSFIFIKFDDVLKLDEFESFKAGIAIAIAATCILLAIGLIMAFITKKWTKVVNTIIVIIFAIIYLALGIGILVFGKKVPEQVQKEWNHLGEPIENIFHCCNYNGVNSSRTGNCAYSNGDCNARVQKIFVDKATIIGSISIVISVVITAIIIVMCCCTLKSDSDNDDEGAKSKDQFNTPLTYGW